MNEDNTRSVHLLHSEKSMFRFGMCESWQLLFEGFLGTTDLEDLSMEVEEFSLKQDQDMT